MRLFEQLESIRRERGAVAVALIDPDTKNDEILLSMINLINEGDFDGCSCIFIIAHRMFGGKL